MKKWQIENSEISEMLFRVFLFPSFRFCPIAKIENSDLKISGKNFRVFRVFDLAVMQTSIQKNFRLKFCEFIEKRLQHMHFPKNFTNVLRILTLQNAGRLLLLKYLLKIKIAAPGKFSEAAVRRYFSKQMVLKISLITKKHLCQSPFLIKFQA